MKSILSLATACALAIVLATPALAEDGDKGGKGKRGKGKCGRIFAKFDKDKSGTLTSDEVPEKLWSRISKADTDGDGAVSKAEAKAAKKARKGKRGKGRKGKGGGGSSTDG